VIRFDEPLLLLLALPWLLFGLYFVRAQHRACRWIWRHVGERVRARLTLYTPRSLALSMALLVAVGLLLVVAAAGPSWPGGEVRDLTARVVLLLDASASMRATDIDVPGADSGGATDTRQDRFEMARAIARELTERLDGSFALVSFSGTAALQLPMTDDPGLQEEALRVVEVHNFYRLTGSSFRAALDRALPFVEQGGEQESQGGSRRGSGRGRDDLQVVLLSDGEQPFAETFDEPLAALAARGVPVHTVAVGSEAGETRVIYDFRDIVAKADKPATLREYTTRRQDEHLQRIARETRGSFEIAAPGTTPARIAEALARDIRRHQRRVVSHHEEGRRDLSAWLLALVLLALSIEALVPRPARRHPELFDVRRLRATSSSSPALGLVMLGLVTLGLASLTLMACAGEDPAGQASLENGKGIEADKVLLHSRAQTHYERSRAYGVLPEIPTYNLARSLFLQNDYSAAHELYQRALKLAPDLPQAHYNDGHALYRWGVMEADPRGCHVQRTLELWRAARKRFETALELFPPDSESARRSRENLDFLDTRIEDLQQTLQTPPDDCRELPSGTPLGTTAAAGGASAGGAPNSSHAGLPQDSAEATDPQAEPPTSPTAQEGLEQDPLQTARGGADPRHQEPGPGSGGRTTGTAGRADPDRVAGEAPLTSEELEQITRALERLRSQGREGGRFHRRTRAEQFPAASWKSPDREIWW